MSNGVNYDRRRFLGTAAMTIAAAQLGMAGSAKATSGKRGGQTTGCRPHRHGDSRASGSRAPLPGQRRRAGDLDGALSRADGQKSIA